MWTCIGKSRFPHVSDSYVHEFVSQMGIQNHNRHYFSKCCAVHFFQHIFMIIIALDFFCVVMWPMSSHHPPLLLPSPPLLPSVPLLLPSPPPPSLLPISPLLPPHFPSPSSFQYLLCGLAEINVDDWRRYTVYANGYTATDDVIVWFWKVGLVCSCDVHFRYFSLTLILSI